jgi:type II secretory pathway predicted ATPase ExeA
MYYEYWGLKKPPFDNVPDPSMYVGCHTSMENAIAETLFAIEEGRENIAVIVGGVGLGKTLSLRMIINSLDHEKYKIAFITNPGITFLQLVKEIVGQLTGKQYDEAKKVDMLEVFNKLLFDTRDEGKKVLIFIDEANAITPANLESLRLLTNMQDDGMNLFTMVLAGQNELARRLEHPKRANLFQLIGSYNRIDKIQSEELLKTYVETRLKLAGRTEKIFTDDVYKPLWKHSQNGVPRLINKICKLCLRTGETNGADHISGDVVDHIGQRFQKLSGSAVQQRRPRKRFAEAVAQKQVQESNTKTEEILTDHTEHQTAPVIEQLDSVELPDTVKSLTLVEGKGLEEKGNAGSKEMLARSGKPAAVEDASPVEIEINDMKVTINLPHHIIEQGQSLTGESRIKLAGALAAQTLQKHPQLMTSRFSDPVHVWSEIRKSVLNMFGEDKKLNIM